MYDKKMWFLHRLRGNAARWLVSICAALALTTNPCLARAQPEPGIGIDHGLTDENLLASRPPVNDNVRWTSWSLNQHALADDGNLLWIGGVGNVIRYDKAQQTYTRHIPPQVHAHQHIYAVAVDDAGNRWFGGDAGLNRLDAEDHWQHFTPENSGLHEEVIVSIAVAADGTLWFGHDLEPGSVSRLSPDGTWSWFPSRSALVAADYERILTTQNVNSLWTVSGADVWVDLSVYTGTRWIEHAPAYARSASMEPTSQPSNRIIAADGQGNVYVSSNSETVARWDGQEWTHKVFYDCAPFGGMVNRVAVDENGRAWIAWYSRAGPYSNRRAGFDAFDDECLSQDPLPWDGPIADMLATEEGLWLLGPNWLHSPAGFDVNFVDMPAFAQVTDTFRDALGQRWIYSTESAPYSVGGLQKLDDKGTLDLNDDSWTNELFVPVLRAWTLAPNGDLWVASSDGWRFDGPLPLMRAHGGEWFEYALGGSLYSYYGHVADIFVEENGRAWFVYGQWQDRSGVLSLDDGGTPDDRDDDIWTDYPRELHGDAVTAVDTLGRLWLGDATGLYRYEENEWLTIIEDGQSCGLVPAEGGVLLYIEGHGEECDRLAVGVIVIQPDGQRDRLGVDRLITEHYTLVSQAKRRTSYWSVAQDGNIWYQFWGWSTSSGEAPTEIRRFDGTNAWAYRLQHGILETLSAGADGQLWAHDGHHLLRMTHLPDFSLSISPFTVMVATGAGATTWLDVKQISGFDSPITLTSTGQPAGMTVTFAQNPVMPGADVAAQVSVDASVAYGTYELTFTGTSGAISHSTTLAVLVAADRFELYLPQLPNLR